VNTNHIKNRHGSGKPVEFWVFWGILIVAVVIRLVGFGRIPYGVNQDEAMGAVDGWALAQYGTDRFGVRLPVHFSAWQVSQMSVLLSYLMIPVIKLFGFSTTVIRIPILLASIGGIVLMYLIGKHLFSRRIGLIAMALTAINPWHFMQSRWSLDCNLFPHVFLLGFFLLLLAVEKSVQQKIASGATEAKQVSRVQEEKQASSTLEERSASRATVAAKQASEAAVQKQDKDPTTVAHRKTLGKRLLLLASMVAFGLTFYCYGIAVYSVTAFLVVYAICCLKKKVFSWGEILASIVVFLVVALPEILVMAINMFHWQTIDTGWITMSRFPESVRGNDILFLNFSFVQLGKNILAMVKTCFVQTPDYWFNTIPWFGPLYHISIPFMCAGTAILTYKLFRGNRPQGTKASGHDISENEPQSTKAPGHDISENEPQGTKALGHDIQENEPQSTKAPGHDFPENKLLEQFKRLAVWGFLLTGIWVGLITYEVNVNRINIIFYPLILVTAYAIGLFVDKCRKAGPVIGALFGICGILFLGSYFTIYPEKVAVYYNGEFLEAVQKADETTKPLYITGNMGWQFNLSMAEILTQYACKTDALYFQGKTNQTGGRTLAPYADRYHFINAAIYDWENADPEGVYLLQERELNKLSVDYQVCEEIGQFIILEIEKD